MGQALSSGITFQTRAPSLEHSGAVRQMRDFSSFKDFLHMLEKDPGGNWKKRRGGASFPLPLSGSSQPAGSSRTALAPRHGWERAMAAQRGGCYRH